jgi:hypothetical protein
MTAMRSATTRRGLRRAARRGLGWAIPSRLASAQRAGLALAGIALALAVGGCSTTHPRAIPSLELAEAETFPYFRIYWVGPTFACHPLAAADGLKSYVFNVGDSVYYGDCVRSKGIFGGGSCLLPLQVTTVIYRLHKNSTLGPQRNLVLRGVPATIYDEGRSIELYSGRVAIDIFSDTPYHALRAAGELRPLNAPGAATGNLPPPVYCPELSGTIDAQLTQVMEGLPQRACQRAAAAASFATALTE